jgi:hypothetical protein
MRSRSVARTVIATGVVALLGAVPSAQWAPATVALRTNGSVMRAGDCLRLELVALEYAPGPFVTQVRYAYAPAVRVAIGPGWVAATRPHLVFVERAASPTMDAMQPFQVAQLDDSFCFGHGTPPGRYDIDVRLLAPGASSPFGVLRTCVVHDDGSGTAGMDCGLMLRAVKRADVDDTLVFDGDFPGHGPYRALVFRDRTFDRLIDAGVYQTGPHELVINTPGLSEWRSQPVDLVILDETRGDSTTLDRLVVPRD